MEDKMVPIPRKSNRKDNEFEHNFEHCKITEVNFIANKNIHTRYNI